jgi:hypothetical protein
MDTKIIQELIQEIDKKDLLELIDRKISNLKELRKKLDPSGNGNQLEIPINNQEQEISQIINLSGYSREVYNFMIEKNKSISPADIYKSLNKKGSTISRERIRQILIKYKGRYFKSPERGLWRIKK